MRAAGEIRKDGKVKKRKLREEREREGEGEV